MRCLRCGNEIRDDQWAVKVPDGRELVLYHAQCFFGTGED